MVSGTKPTVSLRYAHINHIGTYDALPKLRDLLLPRVLPIPSCGPEFDVEGSDPQLLASLGYILGSQHGSVWRGLVSVSLHLHPTSDTADGFPGNKSTGSSLSYPSRIQSALSHPKDREQYCPGRAEDEGQSEHHPDPTRLA